MRKLLALLLIAFLASFVWRQYAPIQHAPGVLVRGDPEQILLQEPEPLIKKNGWTLKPLAHYVIEARVLAKAHYTDDGVASIAPYDLALGWGRMSDTAVLEKLDITQGNRYYHWQYWGDAPIPSQEIICHSANNHLIPADDGVAEKIAGLRVGSMVKIAGYLVEATNPLADRPWRSSLTRDDSGDGACEIIYVRTVVVE